MADIKDLVHEILTDNVGAAAYLQQRWLSGTVDVLFQARKAAGLTQADIAARLLTTQSAIARMERDMDGGISLRRFIAYLLACGRVPSDVLAEPFEAVRQRMLAAQPHDGDGGRDGDAGR